MSILTLGTVVPMTGHVCVNFQLFKGSWARGSGKDPCIEGSRLSSVERETLTSSLVLRLTNWTPDTSVL